MTQVHVHSSAVPAHGRAPIERRLLDINDVSVRYNGTVALDAVTAEVLRGERLAVVGPNGAGKSTLFKVIAGVLRPNRGSITTHVADRAQPLGVAYVPQRGQVDWSFPVSVADVVMMGRAGRIGLLRWPKPADRAVVRECLEAVGMAALADRQVGELSGGQQQRVFIARALAQEAELMLMDEPLTGLDVTSQDDIFSILDDLRRRGVTVVVSTHDLQQAAEHFDRVLLLNRRVVSLGPAAESLSAANLKAAYGGQVRLIPAEGGLLMIGDSHCDHCDHEH